MTKIKKDWNWKSFSIGLLIGISASVFYLLF